MADKPSFADYMRRGEVPLPQAHEGAPQPRHGDSAQAHGGGSAQHSILPPDSDREITDIAESYRHNGIGEKDLQKLRRSAPEGELDLHGLTVAEAHAALDNFLQRAAVNRWQIVEIIHGRGLHSNNSGGGILRGKTRQWLSGCPAVLAFIQPPKNSGAVLVLLRQPRHRPAK